MSLMIREAVKEDVPKILPVWREMMEFHAQRDRHYTCSDGAEQALAEFVRDNIAKEEASVFVAENEHGLVGYCQCMLQQYPKVFAIKEYGQIVDMAVSRKYRRQGIGGQLFERMMNWFQSKGLERIEVRVTVTNEISTRFWRKMGFETFAETMYQPVDLPERT
jgi:ribosomal protein S18 acetylase RimI-like enzyme